MATENVIGTNVVRLRVSKSMSQKALAERARLSRLGLAKIERGEALPRTATMRALAGALGGLSCSTCGHRAAPEHRTLPRQKAGARAGAVAGRGFELARGLWIP